MATRDLGIKLEFVFLLVLVYLGPVVATLLSQRAVRIASKVEDNTDRLQSLKIGLGFNLAAGCAPLLVFGMYSLPGRFPGDLMFFPLFLSLAPLCLGPCGAYLVLRHGRGWIRVLGLGVSVVVMVVGPLTFFGGMVGP